MIEFILKGATFMIVVCVAVCHLCSPGISDSFSEWLQLCITSTVEVPSLSY
jgi:hypothetical protein